MIPRAVLLLAAAGLVSALPAAAVAQTRVGGVGPVGEHAVRVVPWRDLPFRTVVRQQYDYSCGSAALATLLHHHYGVRVGEAEVFEAMWRRGDQERIRKVGFSLLDMKRELAARGFTADGFRAPLEELERRRTPAVALITVGTYRHFVVIKGVRADTVLVGDPNNGLQWRSRREFESVWNGVLFFIHQGAHTPPRFDDPAEWRAKPTAPLRAALDDGSLARLTAETAPLHQISVVRTLGGTAP